MEILVITPDYPNRHRVHYPFVKQLVDEFARQGHRCTVVAPYSITNNKRFYKLVEYDGPVQVFRPNYLSFSNLSLGNIQLSDYFRRKAVNRVIKQLNRKPDIVYCHFWISALDAGRYAITNQIPLFVASGESTISSFFDPARFPKVISDYLSGVICVSNKNKEESISLGLTSEEKCIVNPNAVNQELFKPKDSVSCRRKLGFPLDAFIISFVGAFIERKGANRVSEAIKRIKGKSVYSIFVGIGDVQPDCDNIVFKGGLRHEEIPDYLCASDVFVLPTQREGCCNAIVEAMSCGLPIISSNLPFNWDILDASNAILIDPDDIEALSGSLQLLRDNASLRKSMAESSLKKARSLAIDNRANTILDFIESRIRQSSGCSRHVK